MNRFELGNARLLELADYVENQQLSIERHGFDATYDQRELFHDCGAPACLLGHAHTHFGPGKEVTDSQMGCRFFKISLLEWDEIFSSEGCNNAKRDWRKAVAYVRKFVADRECSYE